MSNKFERYKKDLKNLITRGALLCYVMAKELNNGVLTGPNLDEVSPDIQAKIKKTSFNQEYDKWYNESLAIIRLLMPDRLDEFRLLYKNEKRKEISYETYTVSDYLIGLVRKTTYGDITVPTSCGYSKYERQFQIVMSLESRFESSLFDMQQLVQADMFDSELDAARELWKKGFLRAAGAICGVILEKHFAIVLSNHQDTIAKKVPHISDYNEALKNNDIIEIPTWRFIQRLGDLRNLCDHNKDTEPTKDDVDELIKGTDKILKTLY